MPTGPGQPGATDPDQADPAPILARCKALGFAAAGIAAPDPSEHAAHFSDWLAAGKHASMTWLEDYVTVRTNPRRLLPDDQPVRAVLMVMDLYESRTPSDVAEPTTSASATRPTGTIARYARGRDYHRLIKRRLHALADELRELCPGHEFRTFVDSAPAMERELAARAGLGWQAKNTMLIHPRLGSYALLGGVAMTLPVRTPEHQRPVTDHCGSCTRCIDACPTDAIETGPASNSLPSINAGKCISYLTIEHRTPIGPALHPVIGDWLFGCDICQEVCPHNSPADLTWQADDPTVLNTDAHEGYAPVRTGFDLLEVLGWTEHDRRRAFHRSPMKRANLQMMKRNALIALTNELTKRERWGPEETAMFDRVAATAADPDTDELVRTTAAHCLSRLDGSKPA